MELAPRDIVARATQQEIDEGRGFEDGYVLLDLRHLKREKIAERLPGIRLISMDFAGVDPVDSPIPVQPGQHYSMGGVAAGNDLATELPGLYAAGECSCVSVHGTNRLGGNSLLETVVFGKLAGKEIGKNFPASGSWDRKKAERAVLGRLSEEDSRIKALLAKKSGVKMHSLRDELKKTMFEYFGVFREGSKMEKGLKKLLELKATYPEVYINNKSPLFNHALIYTLELDGLFDIAEAVARGAISRQESRGSHSRVDYPESDDEKFLYPVLHQLDQKIIYPHYDFKYLTEKYFEIGMKLDDFLIQLVKYCYHTIYRLKDGKPVLESLSIRLGKFPIKSVYTDETEGIPL